MFSQVLCDELVPLGMKGGLLRMIALKAKHAPPAAFGVAIAGVIAAPANAPSAHSCSRWCIAYIAPVHAPTCKGAPALSFAPHPRRRAASILRPADRG